MRRQRALTFFDTLFLLLILIVLIGIALPILTRPRRPARSMQNSTALRGIHSGLVLYSQGNNGYYPGIMADGVTVDPEAGLTTLGRMQKLLDGHYITVALAHHPAESTPQDNEPQPRSIQYARDHAKARLDTNSYAMLQVNRSDDEATVFKGGRNDEWKDTTNTQAVVLSDRAIDNGGSFAHIKSLNTNPAPGITDWRGSVGWNDNHVTFEATSIVLTQYGQSPHAADNLFERSSSKNDGDDAYMVWHGTDEL